MKKKAHLFMIACMAACLLPSLGTLFRPTTQTTENKRMAEAPQLLDENGKFNTEVFEDFEDYFDEHMAFRNPLIWLDAQIQTKVFGVSNVDTVIYGKDGWLYYTSTLNDYQGTNLMSERELSCLANNLSIVDDYLTRRDITFLFTIPPNKNTLYGEYMPYYDSVIAEEDHNARLLEPYLEEAEIPYVNLFDLLESADTEAPLYLKRDSHWNNKGACLAYNALMDGLELDHEDYLDQEPLLTQDENGDLNQMLYSFYGKTEENYTYDIAQDYSFEMEGASVEDGWIITDSASENGTLLMFRDSFANTLIPFLSNEFTKACYSKGQPHTLESYVEQYDPDYVIFEKVERNLSEYLTNPPIISAPEVSDEEKEAAVETEAGYTVSDCMYDINYVTISGSLAETPDTEAQIFVEVNGITYRAYQTSEKEYLLYLKKEVTGEGDLQVRVLVR